MLEVKNLYKVYRPKKGVPVTALKDVSLKFPEKGMVFILGKSGSGKSTLLNVLGGLDNYDDGEIIIKGKSSKHFSQSDFDSYRNTYLGFIFQEYNILNEFNVAANISLALELQGKKASKDAVEKILTEVDLSGYGNRKPAELSGGQKQRVAIARALVKDPEIILADEPTGALDSNTGLQVFDTLKKLSRDKLVIVVTHDRDFAELYGDRVIEFKDGVVISDIEKYSARAKAVGKGLSIIDDKIIRIKKGYTLTAEDLPVLNKYLRDNEALISTDEKSNKDLKRFARIDDEGNKESFKDTDESKIVYSDKKNFRLIKSRLPFKNSLKIGASSLKNKPVRLIVTIILSVIAFTMFGLADTIASYDKYDATYNSIVDSDIDGVSFQKNQQFKYNETDDYYNTRTLKIDDSDLTFLNEKTGLTFAPVYSDSSYGSAISFSDNILDGSQQSYYYSVTSLGGVVETDPEMLEKAKYTVYGTLPSAYDEVAISYYYYELLANYGYRNNDGLEITSSEIISPEAFLAKKPTAFSRFYESVFSERGSFRITAIIDTKLDSEHFSSLKEKNPNALSLMFLENELKSTVEYGYHGMAFVKKGFFNDALFKNETVSDKFMDLSAGNSNAGLYYSDPTLNTSYSISQIYTIANFGRTSNELDTVFFETGKTSLEKGEVLISAANFFNFVYSMYPDDDTAITMFSESNNFSPYVFIEIGPQKLAEAGLLPEGVTVENFAETEPYELERLFSDAIDADRSAYKAFHQKYVLEKYSSFFESKNIFSRIANMTFDFSYNADNVFENKPASVKGIYFYHFERENNFDDYSITISESDYLSLSSLNSGKYAFALAYLDDNAKLRPAIDLNYADPVNDTYYRIQNGVMSTLNTVNNLVETLSKVFLYVGLALAAFSALMLTNFISTSVAYKKHEIGILRAVGAKSGDVYGIFANESLIIALINFVLSVIATVAAVFIINNTLRNQYNFTLTILNFGIRQLGIMLGVSVGVALIASFVPSYRISRKKPIDAIRR